MKAKDTDKKAELIERRRRQILSAATGIFARKGFARTTIDDIAAALSIGKGTIYRYFKDKRSLFLAVYESGMQQLNHSFEQNVHPITAPQLRISKAVKTYFEFFDTHPDMIEIMMQIRSEFKDYYRKNFLEMYSDYIVRIQQTLRNGIEMGIFNEMDVEKTADTISATLHGVLQGFYIREFSTAKSDSQNTTNSPNNAVLLNKTDFPNETDSQNETNLPNEKKESLSDRTDAVTALLLSGLLKK